MLPNTTTRKTHRLLNRSTTKRKGWLDYDAAHDLALSQIRDTVIEIAKPISASAIHSKRLSGTILLAHETKTYSLCIGPDGEDPSHLCIRFHQQGFKSKSRMARRSLVRAGGRIRRVSVAVPNGLPLEADQIAEACRDTLTSFDMRLLEDARSAIIQQYQEVAEGVYSLIRAELGPELADQVLLFAFDGQYGVVLLDDGAFKGAYSRIATGRLPSGISPIEGIISLSGTPIEVPYTLSSAAVAMDKTVLGSTLQRDYDRWVSFMEALAIGGTYGAVQPLLRMGNGSLTVIYNAELQDQIGPRLDSLKSAIRDLVGRRGLRVARITAQLINSSSEKDTLHTAAEIAGVFTATTAAVYTKELLKILALEP